MSAVELLPNVLPNRLDSPRVACVGGRCCVGGATGGKNNESNLEAMNSIGKSMQPIEIRRLSLKNINYESCFPEAEKKPHPLTTQFGNRQCNLGGTWHDFWPIRRQPKFIIDNEILMASADFVGNA